MRFDSKFCCSIDIARNTLVQDQIRLKKSMFISLDPIEITKYYNSTMVFSAEIDSTRGVLNYFNSTKVFSRNDDSSGG